MDRILVQTCVPTIRTTKRTEFFVFCLTTTMSQRQCYLAFVCNKFGTKQAISTATERVRRYIPPSANNVHSYPRILKNRPTVVTINHFVNDIISRECNRIKISEQCLMALSHRRANNSSALRIKKKKREKKSIPAGGFYTNIMGA